MRIPDPDRLADLKCAMRLIAEAVDELPENCRDMCGNALLNVATEAVVDDVGCLEASRIFSRLADLLANGHQPPSSAALSLNNFDA